MIGQPATRVTIVLMWIALAAGGELHLTGQESVEKVDNLGSQFVKPPITALAFSPDGQQIVLGAEGRIEVFDIASGESSFRLKTQLEYIHDLEFSPDGEQLGVAGGSPGETGEVELFNWSTREVQFSKSVANDVLYDLAWTSDQLLAAGHDADCRLIDAKSGKVVKRWSDHSRPIHAVGAIGSRHFLTGSADMTVRYWDRKQSEARRSLNNHTGEVVALAVGPAVESERLRMVTTSGKDRTVRLWQPAIGRLVRFARLDAQANSLCWAPSGKRVYAGCSDGVIRVVDAASAQVIVTHPLPRSISILCIAHHPTSGRLAVGGMDSFWTVLPAPATD